MEVRNRNGSTSYELLYGEFGSGIIVINFSNSFLGDDAIIFIKNTGTGIKEKFTKIIDVGLMRMINKLAGTEFVTDFFTGFGDGHKERDINRDGTRKKRLVIVLIKEKEAR